MQCRSSTLHLLFVAATAAVSLGILPFMYLAAHLYISTSNADSPVKQDRQPDKKEISSSPAKIARQMPLEVQTDSIADRQWNPGGSSHDLTIKISSLYKRYQ